MGIFCEINLFKPADGAFVPGEIVTGRIKYTVDKEIEVTKTIVSLKGSGYLRVREHMGAKKRPQVYTRSENYVDIDHILQQDDKGSTLSCGQHEMNFSFKIPEDIPPSVEYDKSHATCSVRCKISYYVRIKFERSGLFNFNKHFKKVITVVSGLKPRLPISPTVFGQQKKLFQPFKKKISIVNIKANVECCVIQPGGKIELNYEVFNDTNVSIKNVDIKVKEILTFKPIGHHDVIVHNNVPNTETRTSAINKGESQNMLIIMHVPSDYTSIENSKLVSREYFVKITAHLPMPYINGILAIPVQIGDINCEVPVYSDAPPSYWEAMGEVDDKAEED